MKPFSAALAAPALALLVSAALAAPLSAQDHDHGDHHDHGAMHDATGHGEAESHESATVVEEGEPRLTLETPVEVIAADPAGRAVLDENVPGMTSHEHYEMFKGMTLMQLAGYAPDRLPQQLLDTIAEQLAAIR